MNPNSMLHEYDSVGSVIMLHPVPSAHSTVHSLLDHTAEPVIGDTKYVRTVIAGPFAKDRIAL